MFGMISAAGTGTLIRLHGKINTTVYKEILKKHVLNLRIAFNQSTVFMQDNDPCHTAKTWMLLLWSGPAQRPDMNPIENVRKLLNEKAKEKKIQETLKNYGLI